jgi:hypothetical protein
VRLGWSLAALALVGCGGSSEVVGSSSDAGADLDVTGSWHQCGTTLELEQDGTFTRTRLTASCSESGSYVLDGNVLSLSFDQSGCAEPTPSFGAEAVRVDARLVLVKPDSTETYFASSIARARWEVTGKGEGAPANGTSIVHIVGDPAVGPFSGCYWSADGACGGLLSCGGSVESWQLDADSFIAKIGCKGNCPCAALLQGEPDAVGGVDGAFTALDCGSTYQGTFVAKPLAEP